MKRSLVLTILVLETSCGNNTGFKGAAKSTSIPEAAAPEADAKPTPAPAQTPITTSNVDVKKIEPALSFAGLDGMRWELPCQTEPVGAAFDCKTNASVDQTVKMGGDASTIYTVKLRFRGVVEPMMYKDGATGTDKNFYVGGIQNEPGFNIYKLAVENPKKDYYLNASANVFAEVFTIDYTVDVKINGLSNVQLYANNQNGTSIANLKKLTIPGIATAPALLSGQFVQMDVVSVVADPK